MRKPRPNLAAALFIFNVLASILSYTDPTPSLLDHIVMVTGPVGAVAMAYCMYKDGVPFWFKELMFWIVFIGLLYGIGYYLGI